MKIVLFQPQIPQNTGNIARTCAATNTDLVLVRPLGFSTHSRHLKRAGLDYWDGVDVEEIDDLARYLEQTDAPFYFFSSKVEKFYTEAEYAADSLLIFGSETTGLPPLYKEKWGEHFRTIPMAGRRCLNLANSVNIVLYEALRQNHFSFGTSKARRKESTALMSSEEARGA